MYLVAWLDDDEISIPNNQGKTALHIAVLSSEDIDSGRTLRILVTKGANVNAKDHKNRTALDTVEYVERGRL
jgi:ankyrin repeat protein